MINDQKQMTKQNPISNNQHPNRLVILKINPLNIVLPLIRSPWSFPKKYSRGFSLLEILLVVVILSVLAALTVPNFSPAYSQMVMKKAADDLAFAMRYAQVQAVTKDKNLKLQFDESYDKYWLVEAKAQESGNLQFGRLSGRMGKTFTIPDGVTLQSDQISIDFSSNGDIQKTEIQLQSKDQTILVSTADQKNYVLVYTPEESQDAL